jgi:hypothetical protein
VILNLLRIRKEFGTKIALNRVVSFESIAPSDDGKAQGGERPKKNMKESSRSPLLADLRGTAFFFGKMENR